MGYTYSPYGESRHSAATSAVPRLGLGYIGGETSAANMLKLGARYYDASTGRFTQMDPAGQEANPYTYAQANPCNLSDPTGLRSRQQCLDIVDAVTSVRGVVWSAAGAIAAISGLGAGLGAFISGYSFLSNALLRTVARNNC